MPVAMTSFVLHDFNFLHIITDQKVRILFSHARTRSILQFHAQSCTGSRGGETLCASALCEGGRGGGGFTIPCPANFSAREMRGERTLSPISEYANLSTCLAFKFQICPCSSGKLVYSNRVEICPAFKFP